MAAAPQARTRILDAAEHLFARHGFDATPTSKIATKAEVPKGLLFYYFPMKSDILTSLISERLGPATLDGRLLAVPGNPVQALLNVSKKLFQVQSESDVIRVIMWREESTHPEVKASLAAHVRALHDTIEQALKASLRTAVADYLLRPAAVAWGAIVTARPGAGVDVAARHDLRAIAELICAGLYRQETLGA
jgi:AcrR family transcriptional regulator